MLNNNINSDLLRCRIYRLLFLLFLAAFAVSPIVDSYLDSFCSSSVYLNDLNDADSPVSINELNLNELALIGPECHIIKIEVPLITQISSQDCSLLSSDPSPPVI
jgi:hypothetical protein